MNVRVNEKTNPNTIAIWFQGQSEDASYTGENYLINTGLIELIIPITIPCKHLPSRSALMSWIISKQLINIITIDSICRHYFLLNLEMRVELQKAPRPPVNDRHPVSIPWIRLSDWASML